MSCKFEIDQGPTDSVAYCAFWTLVINNSVKTRGHSLIFNISADLILGFMDEPHLHQVLLNLLSNAIKYKPKIEL